MSQPPTSLRVMSGVAVVALTIGAWFTVPTEFAGRGGDSWVYLAAGERLNSGHRLYELVEGDRWVRLLPPVWPTPLMSPPPIAALWRLLAPIGDLSMVLWCTATVAASAALILWALARARTWGLYLAVLVGPILVHTSIAGNANGLLAPFLALAWARRHHGWLPALAVLSAVAVKVSPVTLVPWLWRRDRLPWAVGLAAAGLIMTELLAPGALRDWFATSAAGDASPAALSTLLGTDRLWTAAAVACTAVVACFLLRRHEGAVFLVGVAGAVLSTPALYLHTVSLLTAALAVAVPPVDRRGEQAVTRWPNQAAETPSRVQRSTADG